MTGPDRPDAGGDKAPITPNPEPAKAEKPKWLPNKFWNAEKGEPNYEGLATSYGELERKQAAPKPPAKADDKKADAKPAEGEAAEAAKTAVEAAGLNFEDLSTKFYDKGALDETDYESLQKAGIPRTMVDSYIKGIELQVREFTTSVVGQVGGPEAYAEMTTWAQQSLSPEEIAAYNASVNSGDYTRAMNAVKALKSDFTEARGKDPNLVGGKRPAMVGGDSYASWAQVTADMALPAYKKDAAFRQSVEDKIARSKL